LTRCQGRQWPAFCPSWTDVFQPHVHLLIVLSTSRSPHCSQRLARATLCISNARSTLFDAVYCDTIPSSDCLALWTLQSVRVSRKAKNAPRSTANLGNEDALRQAPTRVSPTYTASLGRLLLAPAHRSAKSPDFAQHVWFKASLISSQSLAQLIAVTSPTHLSRSTFTMANQAGLWKKRVLVPFWIVRICIMLFLIGIYAYALRVVDKVGDVAKPAIA
jgi:hypothetical protein